VVDGPVEARQAHGRAVPIQLCRTTQRRLPAMGAQRERRKHVEAKQRPGAAEAGAAEAEEHVQEAIYGLRGCRRSESSCCSARKAQGRRHQLAQRQCQDQISLLVDEEVVYREP
jgi:hypothetical protein